MLTRRDTLRLAALSALAVSGLSACGSTPEAGPVTDSGIDLASSSLARTAGLADGVPDVVGSLQGFAGHLYGQAPAEGNLIISPFSVAMALGMAVNGAAGQTKSEMLDVLGVGDLKAFNGGLNALTQELESLAGPVTRADGSKAELALDSANSLWGQRDTAWQEAFLDELARDYGTGMRLVDYKTAAERARTLINHWTADKTHDKITDIIPPGALDAMTRLVLVNAIYLKAPWEKPFEPSMTKDRPFDGGRLTVPMMSGSGVPATQREGDGWQAATLAYAGGSVAMTIVLPDEGRLGDVEASLGDTGAAPFVKGGRSTLLSVTMPRWTARSNLGLGEALTALGMPTAFDAEHADFSAMTAQEQLYISAVLHQGFIAVDEEGTEAAAATAVVMDTTSMPITTPFVVNRPFLYVVHDTAHGTPLFLGRVTDPSA
jgi:serpin B